MVPDWTAARWARWARSRSDRQIAASLALPSGESREALAALRDESERRAARPLNARDPDRQRWRFIIPPGSDRKPSNVLDGLRSFDERQRQARAERLELERDPEESRWRFVSIPFPEPPDCDDDEARWALVDP
jgi:hypothetical protein